jgi:transcriptional regulator with XRE-family HTH domain
MLEALDARIPATPEAEREAAAYRQVLQLGTALRAARVARDWSQGELSARAGVSQSDISKIENGALPQGPTCLTLGRLGYALDAQLTLTTAEDGEAAARDAQAEAVREILREELERLAERSELGGALLRPRVHGWRPPALRRQDLVQLLDQLSQLAQGYKAPRD